MNLLKLKTNKMFILCSGRIKVISRTTLINTEKGQENKSAFLCQGVILYDNFFPVNDH